MDMQKSINFKNLFKYNKFKLKITKIFFSVLANCLYDTIMQYPVTL